MPQRPPDLRFGVSWFAVAVTFAVCVACCCFVGQWGLWLHRAQGGPALPPDPTVQQTQLDCNCAREHLINQYFDRKYVLPEELLTLDRPAIICVTPHNILPWSTSGAISKLFGGRLTDWGGAPVLFKLPMLRPLLAQFGTFPAGKKGIHQSLADGNNVGLVLDGIAGIVFCRARGHGDEQLYLRKRKAVCAIALQSGAPIVPAYCFGSNEVATVLADPLGLLRWLSIRFDVSLTPFVGRWGVPMGAPRRKPLLLAFGPAIECTQLPLDCDAAAVSAAVDAKHAELLEGYRTIFETHKEAYGYTPPWKRCGGRNARMNAIPVADEDSDDLPLVRVRCYARRALHWRLDVAPLCAAYAAAFGAYALRPELEEVAVVGTPCLVLAHLLLFLATHWSVRVRCATQLYACPPARASLVCAEPASGAPRLCPLEREAAAPDAFFFTYHKRKYLLGAAGKGGGSPSCRKLRMPSSEPLSHYAECAGLQTPAAVEAARARCLDDYWYYSVFTLLMLLLFECTVIKSRLRNVDELSELATPASAVLARRCGKWERLSSTDLLPGDLVALARTPANRLLGQPVDTIVPADVLLLHGSLALNESALTGESTPQLKEPLPSLGLPPSTRLNLAEHRACVALGGTKLLQHSAGTQPRSQQPPGGGAVGVVLRTGFHSSQGKLMRTILFATERVNGSDRETLLFILFLLAFAIAAAGHELSLAVNHSLLALHRRDIFCTEPFRIPFAGKVQLCCFDKTGTLTSDDLVVQGVAALHARLLTRPRHACSELLGDPMDKAAVGAVGWSYALEGLCVSRAPSRRGSLRLLQRFAFASSLKRSSTVVEVESLDGAAPPPQQRLRALCKGAPQRACVRAPETVRELLGRVPEGYDAAYLHHAQQGKRVLALAYKMLPQLQPQEARRLCPSSLLLARDDSACAPSFRVHGNDPPRCVHTPPARSLSREAVESELTFAGFLVLHCPAKSESAGVLAALSSSSHGLQMITGDQMLTAAHAAAQLRLITKPPLLLAALPPTEGAAGGGAAGAALRWESFGGGGSGGGEEVTEPFESSGAAMRRLAERYALCCDGAGFEALQRLGLLASALPHELALSELKRAGITTLMCGDGTNDERLQEHELPRMKLGDASIAAAFTARSASVGSCVDIITQGRCTLVTTLQMCKILALNCLVSAFSLSVLHLQGVAALGEEHGPSEPPEPDGEFEPSLPNSIVWLVSTGMLITTFVVNYKGRPYMESLASNRGLAGTLAASALLILTLAAGALPDLAAYLELVPIESEALRGELQALLAIDFGACWLLERAISRLWSY
ncbi:hypothetical protein EMIHUDRAFT_460972 [Emiliania huxleyi CCMP1516]|uniref:Cation-transporting ATPase n=2 Tax=Emiliania huxleyi TaxID=2903 RepID=A0A0D3L140_EMIH1|nr:hypothetical protein EMIHUDRAFT_460972 [Emiliania huxleyi CCMP1516]EOD41725.1 hypothetical protein EMIHUDRAFT_460972 [Emiliania huxleyi CCMP1516]|eukprot:XP_005794154.1 hypothetical protein EMIHUDRAFT_460972 [Emiliania huxleyi CCMP1516]